jgi:prostaglandin-endoperoxide synthase 2
MGKQIEYVNPPQKPIDAIKRKIINFVFPLLNKSIFAPAINRALQNKICSAGDARPHQFSTTSDYTSWESLTNYEWCSRHLPAISDEELKALPDVEKLMPLFQRANGDEILCAKSTTTFAAFAQFITDGFVRSQPGFVKNTATHELDLCQLYGRNKSQTDAMRLYSNDASQKGRVKSQIIEGEEWPMYYFLEDGTVDPQFAALDPPQHLEHVFKYVDAETGVALKKGIFALGGDRTNSTPSVSSITALFLREHNRLAGEIEKRNPSWDDERIFQVARNINIILYIRITLEDYINHISSTGFKYRTDIGDWVWSAKWNKRNRISAEFSILYRWHSLVPNEMVMDGKAIPLRQTLFNNGLLTKRKLKDAFEDFSAQRATSFGPFNTADDLMMRERQAILNSREAKVRYYGDYVDYLGLHRPKSFEDLSSDPKVVEILSGCYKDVDQVELYVGLVCADNKINSPFPMSLIFYVALDAFSQVLTNPLLSETCFREETYSAYGWEMVTAEAPLTLKQLIERNTPTDDSKKFIGFTREGWDLV